ncbi:UNVERIFIED_CONTAM: hypothetical protein K2H54_004622 [Gekko kuhli]
MRASGLTASEWRSVLAGAEGLIGGCSTTWASGRLSWNGSLPAARESLVLTIDDSQTAVGEPGEGFFLLGSPPDRPEDECTQRWAVATCRPPHPTLTELELVPSAGGLGLQGALRAAEYNLTTAADRAGAAELDGESGRCRWVPESPERAGQEEPNACGVDFTSEENWGNVESEIWLC